MSAAVMAVPPPAGIRVRAAGLLLLGLVLAGCAPRRGQAPDWVLSAPRGTATAVSCTAAWALDPAHFQPALRNNPLASQALALFLERTRLDPHPSVGRVTLYQVPSVPDAAAPAGGDPPLPAEAREFLLQLGGFQNPGQVLVALADGFSAAGSLPMDHRDLPLFTILDRDTRHIRAMADGEGRIWMGDLPALIQLGFGHFGAGRAVVTAVQGLSPEAAVQGFLLPEELPEAGDRVAAPGRRLPRGIRCLAWAVTPGSGAAPLHRFELVLVGSRAGIQEGALWLDDLVAAAQSLPGAPLQPPDLLQESRRLDLRWRVTQEQLNLVLGRLNQPALPRP